MRTDLERFLVPLKHLQQLELVVHIFFERELLNASPWEIFLNQHLLQLSTFNFKFDCLNIDKNIIDQYRHPFWLDRHWYVATNVGRSSLFTVPHFAESSARHSAGLISSNWTTLPLEQQLIFYDCVTELELDEIGSCPVSYRFNYVKNLFLDNNHLHRNVLDLSKVQSFIVKTAEWSLFKIMVLIKKRMPSVNSLSLNFNYSEKHQHTDFISLKQIRTLILPRYKKFEGKNDSFNWFQLFPCVERLSVSVNSENQIQFFIDEFKSMVSGHFFNDTDNDIQITRQWLEEHTNRFKQKNTNNFICQINDQYVFSMCLWIGDDYPVDQQIEHKKHWWWRQCIPWK